jgi:uncharacterized protein YciI
MFVVLLKFTERRTLTGQFMEAHKQWLKSGFDAGVFLLAGSLNPQAGGGIVAHNTSLADLNDRVNHDPFVAERIVTAEIIDIAPARVDDRLKFLLNAPQR